MSSFIDLTGQKFGRLVVTGFAYAEKHTTYWNCICDCGNTNTVARSNLVSGRSVSCGCFRKETLSQRRTKHGLSKSRIFKIWSGMKKRCYNPNSVNYGRYGGRGITVCSEWKTSFESFRDWAFLNGYADSLSIDRINPNGNYEPSNCRWTTMNVQCRNTRQNHMITIGTETKCLTDWAHEAGITYETAYKRLRRGWNTEEAVGLKNRKMEVKL